MADRSFWLNFVVEFCYIDEKFNCLALGTDMRPDQLIKEIDKLDLSIRPVKSYHSLDFVNFV